MAFSQFDERTIYATMGNFAFGTSPASTLVAGATGFGMRIDQLQVSWNGAAPITVLVKANDGFGDNCVIGSVTLAAPASGELTTVDAIGAVMPLTQPYILLAASGQLQVEVTDTLTGADVVGWYASGGSF